LYQAVGKASTVLDLPVSEFAMKPCKLCAEFPFLSRDILWRQLIGGASQFLSGCRRGYGILLATGVYHWNRKQDAIRHDEGLANRPQRINW
jgi:hypothetical protein